MGSVLIKIYDNVRKMCRIEPTSNHTSFSKYLRVVINHDRVTSYQRSPLKENIYSYYFPADMRADKKQPIRILSHRKGKESIITTQIIKELVRCPEIEN